MRKENIARPALAKETVDVPELGGEVIVQGLLLKDRLELGQSDGFGRMSYMLSKTVVDEAGEPIYSVEEWEVFGGQHDDVAFKLFNVASRLSGIGGEQKNAETPS